MSEAAACCIRGHGGNPRRQRVVAAFARCSDQVLEAWAACVQGRQSVTWADLEHFVYCGRALTLGEEGCCSWFRRRRCCCRLLLVPSPSSGRETLVLPLLLLLPSILPRLRRCRAMQRYLMLYASVFDPRRRADVAPVPRSCSLQAQLPSAVN